MKKLALKLEDLAVESFHTHASAVRGGTVLGNADPGAETAQLIGAGTIGCLDTASNPDGGTNTCDRRCEPSIANCTQVDGNGFALAPF